ncbi:M20 family metallopeptidase [Tissierella sp. Yu-01]|uniref:M20 family metallopeptidase n=1 Tax=Tissierella sp. Yu-01 TaxID=3035694 RepID=UPI00240CF3EA|nr:M20 family metallopeptidase [Tissierella sp. Yu-01]WFA09272.1 M20 family metallopeptidase [Tissierella sp. Yu-01]
MTNIRDLIDKVVGEKVEVYKNIALQIHEKPEVSNYEFFASKALSEQLVKEGFDVKLDVAGHRTGFDARYKSEKPGPTVVFYAEYDALPGIGHACGHNLFGATSSLAAVGLKAIIDEVGGEIRVYGTPGEEGGENGSAKGSFVKEGFFDDVDIALGAHPGYEHGLTSTSLANDPVDVEFFGKSSHAAGAPEKGINALDAIIQVYNASNALRQHLTDDVRIHGVITNGGEAANVVPYYASARFYLRAKSRPILSDLYTKFENIVKGAALQTGAEYKFGLFQNSVDNVVPTPLFDEVYEKHLNRYGEYISKDNVKKGSGSTDVGNISQVVPTIHTNIKISNEYIAGHSVEFREASRSELGLSSIELGAKILANTALDIILDSDLLERIKKQHAENVSNQND